MISKWIRIGMLLCMSILSMSVVGGTQIQAQTTRSAGARRQQALVKRINQHAIRFYKTFISQSVRNAVALDCELNDLLEDLLLAVDGLGDPRYTRHNLVVVMQIASDIEQELLLVNVSSNVVMAWSRLHADLDRLAKMSGIKWSEAVITDELIAALAGDVDTVSTQIQTELPQVHTISATTSAGLPELLANFRSFAQELNNSTDNKLHYRIEAGRNFARAIDASLNNSVVSSALQRDWRRVTSRLEQFVRLYTLDSLELRPSSQPIAARN